MVWRSQARDSESTQNKTDVNTIWSVWIKEAFHHFTIHGGILRLQHAFDECKILFLECGSLWKLQGRDCLQSQNKAV